MRDPKSIALIGTGGIGKTALASLVSQQMPNPLFWYTVRPGLNDHSESLVFALSLFAHRHGFSNLWLSLSTERTASEAAVRLNERLLSALRFALSQIKPRPLLCFDGLDLLQPATLPQHHAFLQLLASLRGLAAILLIGQQAALEPDEVLAVPALSQVGLSGLLQQQPYPLSSAQQPQLLALTQGNPRLLKLALAALAGGESLPTVQEMLLNAPGIELLFRHTLQQLTEQERNCLMQVSVFRSPAPAHYWQTETESSTLTALYNKGLLQSDQAGGIELPVVYRHLIYRYLSAETRQRLHQQAAHIRIQGGAYTAAAYHLVQAGQPEMALQLWQQQQNRQLAQGQASSALALFGPLRQSELPTAAHELAVLLCAQLEYWTGNAETASVALHDTLFRTPILALEAAELAGVIANDRSEFEGADQHFARALRVSEQLLEVRKARLHKGRAWMHLRQRQLDEAEHELSQAHYEVENMRGNLAMDRGHFEQALQHYQLALQIAESFSLVEPLARTCNNLAGIALFQGRFGTAIDFLERAYSHYHKVGKVADMAGSRITLAVAHNQAGAHLLALSALAEAETLLQQHSNLTPWQQALIAQARAEAHLALGNLALAETQASQAIAAEEVSILPDAYRVYGEICAARGDFPRAEQWLRQSLTLAEANEDRYLAAYAWRALARVYQQQNQLALAEEAAGEAFSLFAALGLAHELANLRSPARQ